MLREVREPGVYIISSKSRSSAESALESAGGAKETAALHRIQLVRPTLRKPIEFELTSEPPQFQDGDWVFVPSRACVVVGGVDKQGRVILTGNETLFDIISCSGTSRARLDQVTVIRAADFQSGNDKKEVYDLSEAFDNFEALPKVPIFDGDVIVVQPTDAPTPYNYLLSQPVINDRVIFPIWR